ncbi:hypothetical protein [Rhizobium leguminosarum]|uniref:hypothetical protein n=1 Tax=Rhizobium leguminosarum TaxID=384 RepID=UPI0014413C0D|nr:hypothetical protein [Rhizobium leguminosarum]MBY5868493.1 hypothetical protein [Rhizobium leguminosarum]NKM07730.1 hypothetical protein [Rhizobium leguminosarum bv. viciae]
MHHQRTGAPGISPIWNMPRWGLERPTGPRRGDGEAKVVQLFGRNTRTYHAVEACRPPAHLSGH